MRRIFVAITLMLAGIGLSPARAQQALDLPSGAYRIDPTHASIGWRLNHMGLSNYVARFAKFDSNVELDAADPTRSKLTVVIDASSLRTDYAEADEKFTTDPRFLDVKQHPEIRFVSRELRWTGPNRGQIIGDLTLKGVTRPLTLDVVLNGAMSSHPMLKVPVFGVSATGSFKRSDFGMDVYVPMVGDDVQLMIEAEYTGK